MRVYIIKDSDFDDLTAAIDRDPQWGENGGSSQILNPEEREAHDRAHRFSNYSIRTWIESIQRSQ